MWHGPRRYPLNRNLISGLAIGVFAGFLAGYFLGASRSNGEAPPVAAMPPAAAAPAMPPGPNPMELQERITANKQVVAADPKNVQAWIGLGNDYFDLHQAKESVDAYGKALELDPKNANVLTDQGVMYRELKQFDKAVANFQKAAKLDPQHVQSLFNLGIVYSQDLNKPAEAIKAFSQVIATAPASPQAAQSRQLVEGLKQAKP
jgi:cytochrome c-type biogenesis protein CcmH/NrfG